MGGVLQSTTTNALTRITVHSQYNKRALGFFLLNNLVPITLNIRKPGGHYKRVILMFDPVLQDSSPYEDFGFVDRECRKIFTFNIRHYVQCFLPSGSGAFTYNLCQICGASVKDDLGQVLQQISRRRYRPDKYVWRADNSLQDRRGSEPVFKHHGGIL